MGTSEPRFRFVPVLWQPDRHGSGPRRSRAPARISAYVPTPISELDLRLGQAALTAVSDAERTVAAIQSEAARAGVGTIAAQLMRSEAIASSQIEGVQSPSSRALAKAEARGGARLTAPARATIANLDAVRTAYARAATATDPMTVDDLRATHAALAQSDRRLAGQAGLVRTTQNWIGRDPYTPVGADFVPPPAEHVPELLADLVTWCSRRDVSPLLQAAVAHAQFETIHPFADGNGRVGRTLIGELLCRGGLARDVLPPVSLVLSGRRSAYIELLTAWRFDDDGPDRWVQFLADACLEASEASLRLGRQVAALQDRWREQSSHTRRDSSAARLIDLLPAHPIVDASQAGALLGVSEQAARAALVQLTEDGVLAQVTLGRRNRAWECVGLFALVDELERTLSGGVIDAAATR